MSVLGDLSGEIVDCLRRFTPSGLYSHPTQHEGPIPLVYKGDYSLAGASRPPMNESLPQ